MAGGRPQSLEIMSAAPTKTPPNITIRPARLIDHFAIARLNTRAFFDDILFGQTIHPYRHRYPTDSDIYWISRNLVSHFDYSHVFLVACLQAPDGKEKIVGQAHWCRIGLSAEDNWRAGWGLRRWDPRRLLQPLVSGLVWFVGLFVENRAADPKLESIVEKSYGYLDHVWDAEKKRCPSWYIESMAVDPDFQGRGIGKLLIQQGLAIADGEAVSASVISADGKEEFYQKCGFETGPVARSGEGEGNPLWGVPGGLLFFRAAADGSQSRQEASEEVQNTVQRLKKDVEQGWKSGWMQQRGYAG